MKVRSEMEQVEAVEVWEHDQDECEYCRGVERPKAVSTRTSSLLTGWMAPSGLLYECEPVGHYSMAVHILHMVYGVHEYGYESLYRRGFVHISEDCKSDMGYSYMEGRPRSSQIDSMFQLWERGGETVRKNVMNFIKRFEG